MGTGPSDAVGKVYKQGEALSLEVMALWARAQQTGALPGALNQDVTTGVGDATLELLSIQGLTVQSWGRANHLIKEANDKAVTPLTRLRNRLKNFLHGQAHRQAPSRTQSRPARPHASMPDPHNTGYGMQLSFNLGGMKGLPRGQMSSQIGRGLNAAYGPSQAGGIQQRLSGGLSEVVQGHEGSTYKEPGQKAPGGSGEKVFVLPEYDREKAKEAAEEKQRADQEKRQQREQELQRQEEEEEREKKEQADKEAQEKKASEPAKSPDPAAVPAPTPPDPPAPPAPAPKKDNAGFPDPGGDGDSGGGESKPTIPYGPRHAHVGGQGQDPAQLRALRNPSLAERMLPLRLAGYRTHGYQSGDDWGAGGYNPHMNGDPDEDGSQRILPGQSAHPDETPDRAPPNPPLSQRIVATRLLHHGEPGYQSGDDWSAGGYNPHMNGDPESDANDTSGASGRNDPTVVAAPSYGPDPDDPWSSGGYNPHYRPSTAMSVVQALTIHRP